MGVFVFLLVGLSFPKHAKAICAGPDPCGSGTTPTAAPTLNVVQALGGSSVYFSWTNNDGGAGTYYIYQSTDNVTFSVVASTTALSFNLLHVYPGFLPASCVGGSSYKYYYYIKEAVSGQLVSPASATASPIFMCPPTIQSVSTVSQTQLTVSWTDNADDEAGFYVYRDGLLVASSQPGTGTGSTLAFGEAAFTCGTKHTYYVKAYNGANISDNSATLTGVTAPCAPTSGSISVVSPTQITVSWTLNGTWVDAYQIYRGSYLAASQTLNANSTGVSLQDSGLQCGTTYSYLLRLWGGGASTNSATITGTTPSCVSAPAPVASALATPVSGSPSINSSWAGTFDGVRVYLKGPTGYSLAGDFASAIKATSFAGLKCPYPYTAYYLAYNNDPSVSGTDASCSSALSNMGISGPAAPTGAKCATAISASVDMRFCTQQFLGN